MNNQQQPASNYPKYENWYADTEKYEAEAATYWRRQNVIASAGVLVNALTFVAAVVAACVAYNAYIAGLNAVAEAKRQAAAAEEQVKVARDAEKRQFRAYLSAMNFQAHYSAVNEQVLPAADCIKRCTLAVDALRPNMIRRTTGTTVEPPKSIGANAVGISC